MPIEITYHSGIYTLKSKQKLYGSMDEVWDFFSRPKNLNVMTPNDLKFEITTPDLAERTYQGQIISYEIEIFPMLKNHWITEITLVKENELFIDEQRFGPYAMWHHEHHFTPLADNEVLMEDIISFKLPMGALGRVVASGLIKNKLKKIFDFRYKFCEERFKK
ncbi:hypothetical protein EDM00_05550 [Ornithobacterium rhinotracheale]|uniref:SRPBCC family protein n=1 Tax=Ornithobacterium rhinotracheale TaxID=28251 RepID=UPI00129C2E3D|nr:SRPBCC family protein [Ornithobacterium rhinotracheale]MRI63454.1 hypothetical protein [Ornithobacterium rhinotracheale]